MSSDSLKTHSDYDLGSVRGVYDDALTQGYVAQYAPYGEIWDASGTDAQPFKSEVQALSRGVNLS